MLGNDAVPWGDAANTKKGDDDTERRSLGSQREDDSTRAASSNLQGKRCAVDPSGREG